MDLALLQNLELVLEQRKLRVSVVFIPHQTLLFDDFHPLDVLNEVLQIGVLCESHFAVEVDEFSHFVDFLLFPPVVEDVLCLFEFPLD